MWSSSVIYDLSVSISLVPFQVYISPGLCLSLKISVPSDTDVSGLKLWPTSVLFHSDPSLFVILKEPVTYVWVLTNANRNTWPYLHHTSCVRPTEFRSTSRLSPSRRDRFTNKKCLVEGRISDGIQGPEGDGRLWGLLRVWVSVYGPNLRD